VRDIAYVIVFLESLFSREFAGFTGLVSKAMLIPGEAAHHNEMIAPTVTE
jgi:hypothetical protein